MVAELAGEADIVVARIVQDILCGAVVSAARVHPMQTEPPAAVARLEGCRSAEAAGVGIVAHIGLAAEVQAVLPMWERCVIEQDDAPHSPEAIAHTLGALDDLDHAGAGIVDLRGVVSAPALALEAHAIIHQEDTAAVHALDHGLGDRAPRADGADAWDGLEHLRQRGGAPLLQLLATDACRLLELGGMALSRRHSDLVDLAHIFLKEEGDGLALGGRQAAHQLLVADGADLYTERRGEAAEAQRTLPLRVGRVGTKRPRAAHDGADDGLSSTLAAYDEGELVLLCLCLEVARCPGVGCQR